MSKIDIIRDNNAPIDNKVKIWLCAHPDDTRAYLDDICRELFDTRDCVVFYEGDPYGEYDREELCRSLSQMNVFVVAVTQKFLDEENRAREVEFKFALENGIRILPILFDADAEGKFNKLCGELHLLKRGAPNYLELLSKSVSIASVSESELEKIRAEFVKRIFFSYRKKDVDSALELIRLIRKNEFCRDVAIWYDDYLVVGENFNDHIKSALLESDLFVLAITESITEKVQNESGKRVNNYVVEKEFPIARSKGKRILPLRMANVSQKKLAVFGGLPPYVNARNEQALAEALIRELGKDILAPRKNGPQHDYYIGLAYLYGIDVEIDRAVAFTLIKRSAERGYAPAMEKLTEMYRNGDGVGVDYSEALAWQRLLVEKYRTRLKEKGCKFSDYIHYFGVLSTLFDYLFEYGATSEINQVCNDALVIANNLYAKAPGPLSRYYVAMIHFTLAEYYVQCGRFDAALENAHKSQELREKNSEEEWSYNEDLLPVYSLIEHLYHSLGDTKNRAIYREKIARLKETINEPLSETDFAFDVFKKVGAIMSEDGIHLEEYDGALEILKQKYKRNRSDENLRSLGQGYSIYATRLSSELRKQRRMPGLPPTLSTGSTYAFGGENGQAKKLSLFVEVINLNRKSIEIYEDIVKRTGVVTDLRNLAANHRKMAEFILDILSEFDTGDEKVASYYADADRHFKRSIDLYSEVVRRTDYIDDKSNLAEIIAQRATHVARMYNSALVGEEALHEGLALLEEGMKIANELLSLVKSVDHESVFDLICLAFRDIYLALGDEEKAEYYDNLALISQI